jgi:hypothetical protein
MPAGRHVEPIQRPGDARVEVEERATLEYDTGMTRAEAERLAGIADSQAA